MDRMNGARATAIFTEAYGEFFGAFFGVKCKNFGTNFQKLFSHLFIVVFYIFCINTTVRQLHTPSWGFLSPQTISWSHKLLMKSHISRKFFTIIEADSSTVLGIMHFSCNCMSESSLKLCFTLNSYSLLSNKARDTLILKICCSSPKL